MCFGMLVVENMISCSVLRQVGSWDKRYRLRPVTCHGGNETNVTGSVLSLSGHKTGQMISLKLWDRDFQRINVHIKLEFFQISQF